VHEGVETLVGLFLACVGEVEGDHRGVEVGVPQGARHETGMHAGFEEMGGVGMPQGRDGHACCGDPGPVCGGAAGALDTGATHGRGSRSAVVVIAPSGGQAPGRVPGGFPVRAEQRAGLFRHGDGPVRGALPTLDLALEALAIDVSDLQGEGCMEPQPDAGDGGAGELVVPGGGGREEPPDLLHPEDGGETGGGVRAHEREGVPVALEDVLGEKAEATGAEA